MIEQSTSWAPDTNETGLLPDSAAVSENPLATAGTEEAKEKAAVPAQEWNSTQGATEPQEPLSFDALLQNKTYQSEFDRRVNKALQTAKAKWQTEKEEAVQEAVSSFWQQKEAELAQKEQSLAIRERKAKALLRLSEQGLPAELADSLNYSAEEALELSLEQVAASFRAAVQKGVGERLANFASPKTAGRGVKRTDPFYLGFDEK
mgnify:CR=1 FL=1